MDKIEKVKANKSPEEAAKKYLDGLFGKGKHDDFYIHLFIAGWKCRDDQMPMPEDTVLFNKGVAEGRRLERDDMMKDAVEAKTFYLPFGKWRVTALVGKDKIEEDDKVRIVVLKEEEE